MAQKDPESPVYKGVSISFANASVEVDADFYAETVKIEVEQTSRFGQVYKATVTLGVEEARKIHKLLGELVEQAKG